MTWAPLKALLLLTSLMLVSCSDAPPVLPSETTPPTQTMTDTFFSGCAHLDANGNGIIDPGDPLLGGMTFTVTLAGGTGFGATSSDGQCAVILVPAGLPAEAWPVLTRISLPDETAYQAAGSTEVTLQYPDTRVDVLFNTK